MSLLIQFVYLQLLDILTTLAFLMNGGKEANPLVRLAIQASPTPMLGLVIMKIFAVCLAVYCLRNSRLRLLARVNLFFAALVTWNLVVLIISSPALKSLT